MKILHTSDWHLGKRTAGKSRLVEQERAIDEIIEIVKREKIDVALIAGDVFDSYNPPAEAEELFYRALVDLSRECLTVATPGNHDDADRLIAPRGLAKASGAILCDSDVGGVNLARRDGITVTSENGTLKIDVRGEVLRLAVLGYPAAAKLSELGGGLGYADYVRGELNKAASGFCGGGTCGVLAHLFTAGGENFATDERELGGSRIISPDVLKIDGCAFVALGHIHKPYVVSSERNIAYSGSLLRYDFADASEKRVLIYETDGSGGVTRREEKLTTPKRLVKVAVKSEEEGLAALDEHGDDYVWLEYSSEFPLASSAVAAFRKKACYCGITAVCTARKVERVERRGKSDVQLFSAFYEAKTGKAPQSEYVEAFAEAMGEALVGGAK